jgi:predicted transcriptional regulator
MKMLKRHLRTAHRMSLDQCRQRWGLPADYPMTAPNYTKTRNKLAKAIGLGTARRRKRTQALATSRSTRSN